MISIQQAADHEDWSDESASYRSTVVRMVLMNAEEIFASLRRKGTLCGGTEIVLPSPRKSTADLLGRV